MTPKLTKQERGEIIAKIFDGIAKHCEINVNQIRPGKYHRGQIVQDALGLLCYYLHIGGLSYDAISRVMQLSTDRIRRLKRQGQTRLTESDKSILEELPRVPTTIKVSSENADVEARRK